MLSRLGSDRNLAAVVYWCMRCGSGVVVTALVGVLVWCTGCTGGGSVGGVGTNPVTVTPTASGASGLPGAESTGSGLPASGCPVTHPRVFDPPPGVEADELFGATASVGNGQLWVGGLGEKGVLVLARGTDGAFGTKFGWWRAIPGELRITGRRLDGSAPALMASVPSGYDPTGFQASGVSFPTDGCWEITGQVGATTLTFVTLVLAGN